MLRSARKLERKDIKEDIINQIRCEFGKNKSINDKGSARALLSEGTRQLGAIQSMAASTIPVDMNNNSGFRPVATSWMESSSEDDIKGRVGEGWPWEN